MMAPLDFKLRLKPSAEDIDNGVPGSCEKCALALCLRRHLEGLGYKVGRVRAGHRSWLDDSQVYNSRAYSDPLAFMRAFDNPETDKEGLKEHDWEFVYHLSGGHQIL